MLLTWFNCLSMLEENFPAVVSCNFGHFKFGFLLGKVVEEQTLATVVSIRNNGRSYLGHSGIGRTVAYIHKSSKRLWY